MPAHIRKGDTVFVRSGSAKGQTGEVVRVDVKHSRVYVKGINLRVKHMRPTQQAPQGSIVQREAPIHISNVSPVVDGKPTRVRFVTKSDGTKVRVAAKGGSELSVLHKGGRTKTKKPH
ncbi:MAG: 50S ribosomal protein L24 [Phycisphaerales bacterium]|nr:50S ribosomal protein L24 [Planctomycetota bacterium]